MELSMVQLGMMTAAALAGGGGVGWWLRGRFHSTQRVIMDELWTRKIKSYQATTTAAEEAHARAATEQAEAKKRMEHALAEATEAQHQLETQQRLEERLREALEKHRERLGEAVAEIERLDTELESARTARQRDLEKMAKLERRARSLAAFPARLEEREAELARLELRVAELGEEKNAEIVRLTDWVAELTPLTETLKRRTEELAELQASRRADEQASRLREEALRADLERHELALHKVGQRQQRYREERDRDRAARTAAERASQELQAALRSERTALEALKGSLQTERALSADLQVRATEGEARAEQALAREAELLAELSALQTEHAAFEETLSLRAQDLAEAREALTRGRVELDRLRGELRENEESEVLEAQADSPAVPPVADHEVLIPRGSNLKSAPLVADDPESRSESPGASDASETFTALADVERDAVDDLTTIKGIGPKIAAKLNAAGIQSFAELARLDDTALGELASQISVPLKRILSDRWVESARELV
jgi:predicted flap endonuclease-1-like 5' DNA nuclease